MVIELHRYEGDPPRVICRVLVIAFTISIMSMKHHHVVPPVYVLAKENIVCFAYMIGMYTPDAEFERCLRMFGKRTKPMNERLMMMNFKREQPSRMKRYEKGLKVTSRSN